MSQLMQIVVRLHRFLHKKLSSRFGKGDFLESVPRQMTTAAVYLHKSSQNKRKFFGGDLAWVVPFLLAYDENGHMHVI